MLNGRAKGAVGRRRSTVRTAVLAKNLRGAKDTISVGTLVVSKRLHQTKGRTIMSLREEPLPFRTGIEVAAMEEPLGGWRREERGERE